MDEEDKGEGAGDIGMVFGVSKSGSDFIVHKEDVFCGIGDAKIPYPGKVSYPSPAVDEFGLGGEGSDIVEGNGVGSVVK